MKRTLREPFLEYYRKEGFSFSRGPLLGCRDLSAWLQNPKNGRWLRRDPGGRGAGRRLLPPSPGDTFEIEEQDLVHADTFVAELPEALVHGPSVAVITPDRHLLRELSTEFGHPPENHGAMRRLTFPKPRRIRGTWALLAVTGGNTYYHHLLEVLPKVHLLRSAGWDPTRLDGVIVSGHQHSFQCETWQNLGLSPQKIVSLKKGVLLQPDRLLVSPLPSHPGFTPDWATDFVRNTFLSKNESTLVNEKLYLTRTGENTRRVVGEESLWPELKKRGFRKFDAQGMSLAEQAEIFSRCSAVLGPHGGAFANIVFSRPGTRVIELFNPRYLNPCYQNLATGLGLRPSFFIGETLVGDKKPRVADSRGDVRLGPETLAKLLAALDT